MNENPLKMLVREGCVAVAVAEPFVIRACMEYAVAHGTHFLLEATVNQVNQFGGYTGMNPADFAQLVQKMAAEVGLPLDRVMLCGDHLGPFAWRHLPAKEAMANSVELVRQYISAGFRKIHLDTTMPVADDLANTPLSTQTIAERAVVLAEAAESALDEGSSKTPWQFRPVYVIGSEVPAPGGTTQDEGMQVTRPEDLVHSLETFRQMFVRHGLPRVWEDVVAVVAQMGVEFSDDGVHDYNRAAAHELLPVLKMYPDLRFESHSTDYQISARLQELASDGAGILKVGPELTFALREGLFSLAMIERELSDKVCGELSNFIEVLEAAMVNTIPNHWESYYHGTAEELCFKRKYSFSDRSRYYFARPEVIAARERLMGNLSQLEIPLPLLSQYMPVQYQKIRAGTLANTPRALLTSKIHDVIHRFHLSVSVAQTTR